ncbi:MAG: SDR family oxidoreductase [Candidatus Anstonellales archaeon]
MGSLPNPIFKIFSLEGKKAIVTGASRGLGESMAIGIAAAGADVALVARSTKDLEKTAKRIEELGKKALVCPCDITKTEQIKEVYEIIEKEFKFIDILVNNAGVDVPAPLVEMTQEIWDMTFSTNLNGVFNFTKLVGRGMMERKRGKIINISSLQGIVGFPQNAAYCATKGAIIAFTRAMAVEWGPYNIQVNAIAPGWFMTDMTRHIEGTPIGDYVISRTPLGRNAQPDEIIGTVLYLSSAASDFLTGDVISLDGGYVIN